MPATSKLSFTSSGTQKSGGSGALALRRACASCSSSAAARAAAPGLTARTAASCVRRSKAAMRCR